MSHKLLNIVVNKNTPLGVEVFSRLGKVTALDTIEVSRDAVRNADILIVRSETRVDRNLLEGSPVRFVGTVTIGTDHIDLDYLASRGIQFASAPGSNSNSVAEYIAAALLVWSQRMRQSLRGKTLGVVGVGNVGSKVVKVARALCMDVILNDPPLQRASGGAEYRPLDELMDADFLTLHVPLTRSGSDATYHLFDEHRIRRMKAGAVLINTSRGSVVESRALGNALSSRHLSTSILDVWEKEPTIDIGLLNQVMLGTPHIAGYSLDGKVNALRMVYEQVCRFLNVAAEPVNIPHDRGDPEEIAVPENVSDEEAILHTIARQAYDIELDDRMLRQVVDIPEGERGRFFMRLRADYRTRREFFNRLVRLPARYEPMVETINDLGFRTETKREYRWAE